MQYRKSLYLTIISLLSLLFVQCERESECTTHAILVDKTLRKGTVNFPYLDNIYLEIPQTIDSDYYLYDVFINTLPNGITYRFNDDTILLEAVPLEEGRYEFVVEAIIEGNFDEYDDEGNYISNELCSTTISNVYTMDIRLGVPL